MRPESEARRGAPVVLVHGAWHGGWCWRDVRAVLEADGLRVFTPTLTGLGERAHLREPVPSLDTHIQDVIGLIEAEELNDVTLVGHSYGGMVITGVADRMKARLRSVVYLDAGVPEDGQNFVEEGPPLDAEARAQAEAGVRALAPDGAWMGVFPAEILGIPPDHPGHAWVTRRMRPHPLRTWLDPLALPNGGAAGLPRTYVWCNAPALAQSSFAYHAQRVREGRAGEGWTYREIATGHDAMVTAPAETAAIIREAASR